MLVFWGSWCGPCMAQVPHERDLVERLKGQPFALLGVDCEENKDTARGVMARERMTWPNWFDGAVGTGPIAKRYHIRGYPTVFVLDAKGVIRARGLSSVGLDDTVDKLLERNEVADFGSGNFAPWVRKGCNAWTIEHVLRHRVSRLLGRELVRQNLQLLEVVLREFQIGRSGPVEFDRC